jgi:hypothetical protein
MFRLVYNINTVAKKHKPIFAGICLEEDFVHSLLKLVDISAFIPELSFPYFMFKNKR